MVTHTNSRLQLSGRLALEPGPSAPAMVPFLCRITGSACTLHLRSYLAAMEHAPEEVKYCRGGGMSDKQSYTLQSQPDFTPNPSSLENPQMSLREPHPHPMIYVNTIMCSFSGWQGFYLLSRSQNTFILPLLAQKATQRAKIS